MAASYRFMVTGNVQGVGFRAAAQEKALSLGLTGWVRNCGDGAVEGVVAAADAQALATFRLWLQRGPSAARVDHVDWVAAGDTAHEAFAVLR
jgi:acylphosphatase